MCGIVGYLGSHPEKVDLSQSLTALSQRGPDRQAEITLNKSRIGHARLSIIDVSEGGDQPMLDPTGRYALVFNGEIYNYQSLAKDLRSQGIELRSNSDTEVLLHLLISKGKDALQLLNGFFAFAFYDSHKDYCLIARDRIGIKPLYHCTNSEGVFFASEMKGLRPLVSFAELDPTAIHFYFRLNYIPAPLTAHKGIKQLQPGYCIEVSKGVPSESQYYNLRDHIQAPKGCNLRELLTDAVRLRMISDVPLGSFLSGGVDSSIIAALACKEDPSLKTFSIGFKGKSHFDESEHAERVAEHIGSDHLPIQLDEDEMLHHVEQFLDNLDTPFADSSAIAVHSLSEHTRKHVTVALSGDGADELFGGYRKHQAHLIAERGGLTTWMARAASSITPRSSGSYGSSFRDKIRKLNRFADGCKLPPHDRYWAWASWATEAEVSELLELKRPESEYRRLYQARGPQEAEVEGVLLADTLSVLPDDMLCKVDRMSMQSSLEVRVPFLDHRVVEFAHSLRAKSRMRKGQGKYILQDAFGDLIPQSIFNRSKKGFDVPLEAWFRGPLSGKLSNALTDGVLLKHNVMSPQTLKEIAYMIRNNIFGNRVHLYWAITTLHNYLKKIY